MFFLGPLWCLVNSLGAPDDKDEVAIVGLGASDGEDEILCLYLLKKFNIQLSRAKLALARLAA